MDSGKLRGSSFCQSISFLEKDTHPHFLWWEWFCVEVSLLGHPCPFSPWTSRTSICSLPMGHFGPVTTKGCTGCCQPNPPPALFFPPSRLPSASLVSTSLITGYVRCPWGVLSCGDLCRGPRVAETALTLQGPPGCAGQAGGTDAAKHSCASSGQVAGSPEAQK